MRKGGFPTAGTTPPPQRCTTRRREKLLSFDDLQEFARLAARRFPITQPNPTSFGQPLGMGSSIAPNVEDSTLRRSSIFAGVGAGMGPLRKLWLGAVMKKADSKRLENEFPIEGSEEGVFEAGNRLAILPAFAIAASLTKRLHMSSFTS